MWCWCWWRLDKKNFVRCKFSLVWVWAFAKQMMLTSMNRSRHKFGTRWTERKKKTHFYIYKKSVWILTHFNIEFYTRKKVCTAENQAQQNNSSQIFLSLSENFSNKSYFIYFYRILDQQSSASQILRVNILKWTYNWKENF